MKVALTISNGQVTGVYLSPDLIGVADFEVVNYDQELTEQDEATEQEIDTKLLIKVQ